MKTYTICPSCDHNQDFHEELDGDAICIQLHELGATCECDWSNQAITDFYEVGPYDVQVVT